MSNSIIPQVTVSNSVALTASSSQSILCEGQSATLTANGASSYSWTNLGNTSSIVVSPTVNTTYTVIGYNGACSDTTIYTQIVADCTGANERSFNDHIPIVFPNPFTNELIITSNSQNEAILINTIGEKVIQESFNGKISLKTSNLESGIYFLKLRTEKGTINFKVIKH